MHVSLIACVYTMEYLAGRLTPLAYLLVRIWLLGQKKKTASRGISRRQMWRGRRHHRSRPCRSSVQGCQISCLLSFAGCWLPVVSCKSPPSPSLASSLASRVVRAPSSTANATPSLVLIPVPVPVAGGDRGDWLSRRSFVEYFLPGFDVKSRSLLKRRSAQSAGG